MNYFRLFRFSLFSERLVCGEYRNRYRAECYRSRWSMPPAGAFNSRWCVLQLEVLPQFVPSGVCSLPHCKAE